MPQGRAKTHFFVFYNDPKDRLKGRSKPHLKSNLPGSGDFKNLSIQTRGFQACKVCNNQISMG